MLVERTTLERELGHLGLRTERAASGDESSFEVDVPDLFREFTEAEQKAIRFTSTLEGGRPFNLANIKGNFDGQGVSVGLMQWTLGAGSLQKLLRKFLQREPDRFRAVFDSAAAELESLLGADENVAANLAKHRTYANTVMNDAYYVTVGKTQKRRGKLAAPWRIRFERLVAEPAFQRIQIEAIRGSMGRAVAYCRKLGLVSDRALVLSFDGTAWPGPYWYDKKSIKRRIDARIAAAASPVSERTKLTIVANAMGESASDEWRQNALNRKLAIVNNTAYTRKGAKTPAIDVADLGLTDQPFTTSETASPKSTAGTKTASSKAAATPKAAPAAVSIPQLWNPFVFGRAYAAAQDAAKKYGNDLGQITDEVFYAIHPERDRRPIGATESTAKAEWSFLRASVVPRLLTKRS